MNASTNMKEVDRAPSPPTGRVSLIMTTYGLLLGEELLHLQLCGSPLSDNGKGTYKLYPGPAWDTVKLTDDSTGMGEWISIDPLTVLHMYLQPGDFKGDSWKRPRISIGVSVGDVLPVSIHTYRYRKYSGGELLPNSCIKKVYTPMIIPQPLPDETVEYSAASMVKIGARERELYLAVGDLSVGTIYYYLYPGRPAPAGLEKPAFYECIGMVEDEYLLLLLNKEDVIDKLAGVYYHGNKRAGTHP